MPRIQEQQSQHSKTQYLQKIKNKQRQFFFKKITAGEN